MASLQSQDSRMVQKVRTHKKATSNTKFIERQHAVKQQDHHRKCKAIVLITGPYPDSRGNWSSWAHRHNEEAVAVLKGWKYNYSKHTDERSVSQCKAVTFCTTRRQVQRLKWCSFASAAQNLKENTECLYTTGQASWNEHQYPVFSSENMNARFKRTLLCDL